MPVMVTTMEIVRFRLSSAPMKRQSIFLPFRPATVPQAQELRGRLVHVNDARWVHFVLRYEIYQAQSELVDVHVQQRGVQRCPGLPAEEMAGPLYAESARLATLLRHTVEDGLHQTQRHRDACLANTVACVSQNGSVGTLPSCSHPAIVAASASSAQAGKHAVAMTSSGP